MKVRLGGRGGRIVRSLSQVTPRDLSADSDVEAEIARVAEAHQPDGGYGETAWNADTKTVYWVCADWTSNEEHDAAEADFLAIDGVDAFEHDAEAALPSGEGWTQVWPEQRPTEAATAAERWDVLIGELEESGQLDPEPAAQTSETFVREPAAEPKSPLEMAFEVMRSIADRPQAAPVVHVHNNDPEQAFGVMQRMAEAFAARPEASPTTVNVQPAAAPEVSVHVPEQEPPNVSVSVDVPAQEPPSVEVHIPEAHVPDVHVQVEAPAVHVEPPQVTVAAAPAPDVHVTVEHVKPGPVRLEVGEDGQRRFIPEEDPENERE